MQRNANVANAHKLTIIQGPHNALSLGTAARLDVGTSTSIKVRTRVELPNTRYIKRTTPFSKIFVLLLTGG